MRHTGDAQALGRFEVFLATAVTTVIVVRAFLIVTGYPKVGGGGLHIAHVLYGGLLMAVAIVIVEVSPGTRSRLRAARVGGVGFGLFIDEVGKFLTKDVNYFFKPAIAIIYVTFIAFYLVVREVVLRRDLTDAQRLAIAATALTDLSLGQLGNSAKQHALDLLDETTSHPELTASLRQALQSESPRADSPEGRITRGRDRLVSGTRAAMEHRHFDHGLLVLFALQGAVVLGQIALLVIHPSAGASRGSTVTTRGAEFSAGVCGAYELYGGAALLRGNRARALRVMFRCVLITILVTQIFVFAQYQATGFLVLVFELLVFVLLRLVSEADPTAYRSDISLVSVKN